MLARGLVEAWTCAYGGAREFISSYERITSDSWSENSKLAGTSCGTVRPRGPAAEEAARDERGDRRVPVRDQRTRASEQHQADAREDTQGNESESH